MRTPSFIKASIGIILSFIILFNSAVNAQYSCAGWNPTVVWDPLKQRVLTNQTVPGTSLIKSWLEYLPDDYHSSNKKYPVLIFIHGQYESVADGNGTSACRLLQGQYLGIPATYIEQNLFPNSVTNQNGETFKFIVISPRLDYFGETSNTINSFIDHLLRIYRIDASRVYLTGISAGAHFIIDYAGASAANARKVAGIAPISTCGGTVNSSQARIISDANLHVYSAGCGTDPCGGVTDQALRVANAVNSIAPEKNLAIGISLPANGWNCTPDQHVSWQYVYEANFRHNIYGRNISLYEWMVQFTSTATGPLPVALEDYTVQLKGGKVYVRWSTSAEENSDHFTIERAGGNQQFTAVGTVASAGNSGSVKKYEWVDENPLANINYYRLSQTDRDGERQIFPVRKILNRQKWERYAIVSPNPFKEELTVFINVDKVQRVSFTLADMSGRVVRSRNATYNEGTAEVRMEAGKLPRGIYVLKVEGEFFSEVQRVVKQ
jgi:hypothetical protein